jgi:predicted 2-oxoglutarate/Fe(II)-dependent dioxygenase YbiX
MIQLTAGDPVPWFRAATSSRPDYNFGSVAGRYIVIAFVSSSRSAAGKACIEAIAARRGLFNDVHIAFFGVTADPIDQSQRRVQDDVPGVRWFYDAGASIARSFGAVDGAGKTETRWFLLDPMLRVMAVGGAPERILDLLPGLPVLNRYAGSEVTAPVLLLARVFEPALCKALIDYYQKTGGEASGFMVERDGKTMTASDYNYKRRSDCIIEDEALRQACRARILRRLVPEIAKCFQFTVSRMERYIVARYSGDEAGYFAPHRDNTTKGTAHRRFAVTLNLNAEEYEGGELRFPEFGARTYRAPTGGAVVFSCSLQHEALPVKSGTRFAFLPFLYDEAAAQLREQNNRYLDEALNTYQRE